MTMPTHRPSWHFLELPLVPYEEAQALQVDCVAARRDGRLAADLFILLEHPPVFTLGRNGGRENLTVSDDFLEQAGVAVVASERGGNITYHGPGQLVPALGQSRKELVDEIALRFLLGFFFVTLIVTSITARGKTRLTSCNNHTKL